MILRTLVRKCVRSSFDALKVPIGFDKIIIKTQKELQSAWDLVDTMKKKHAKNIKEMNEIFKKSKELDLNKLDRAYIEGHLIDGKSESARSEIFSGKMSGKLSDQSLKLLSLTKAAAEANHKNDKEKIKKIFRQLHDLNSEVTKTTKDHRQVYKHYEKAKKHKKSMEKILKKGKKFSFKA